MSVHGQVKVRTSAEQQAAREKEKKLKLDKYLLDYQNVFDQRYSNDPIDLLKQTEIILFDHPDCFTLWNIRRESIEKFDENQQKDFLENELKITQHCLRSNPKSYSCWYQRQWILKILKQKFQLNLYENELNLCKTYLGELNYCSI